MEKLVVYTSETGNTKKYAFWIGEAIGCEVKELKEVNDLKQYDVIYGGCINAGIVLKYKDVKKLTPHTIRVFGVGLTTPSKELEDKIKLENNIEEPFYLFQGGVNLQALGFFKRKILTVIKNSLEKKKDKTEDDYQTLEAFSGKEMCNQESIKQLIQDINGE